MRFIAGLFLVALAAASAFGQTTLSSWSFESITFSTATSTEPSITAGSATADGGSLTSGSSFTGLHSSSSTTWSTPAGNGSLKSISSDHWTVGDYWQFQFATTLRGAISITWDQTGSNTGPRDFKVQYSTDGSNFMDATGTNSTYSLTNDSWSNSGSPKTVSRRTLDLSGVSDLDNRTMVYIRMVVVSNTSINSGIIGSAGSGKIDNFTVNSSVDIPLPVTMKGISATVEEQQIHLAISTATELETAGFNIYRSLCKDGPFELVSSYKSNAALRSLGNSTSGATYTFVDAKVSRGKTYYYRIESVSTSGVSQEVGGMIEVLVPVPKEYEVYQNYPNPFNPATTIRYQLTSVSQVTLRVYDAIGRTVATLVDRQEAAGAHEIAFDGSRYPSGVYYYRFSAVDNNGRVFVRTERMVLMK